MKKEIFIVLVSVLVERVLEVQEKEVLISDGRAKNFFKS